MLIIRPFAPSDAAAIERIYAANAARSLVPDGYGRECVETALDPTCLTLVANVGEEVVACGSVHYLGNASAAFLSYGLVHPDWQRRGIGTAMVLTRLSLLEPPADGVCMVWLSATQHSRPFFARHGFAIHADDGDEKGNAFQTMRFPLTAELRDACKHALARSGVKYPDAVTIPIQSAA